MCVYINELVTRLHVCDSSLPLSSHLPVLGGDTSTEETKLKTRRGVLSLWRAYCDEFHIKLQHTPC